MGIVMRKTRRMYVVSQYLVDTRGRMLNIACQVIIATSVYVLYK